jgi:hypothetical protein
LGTGVIIEKRGLVGKLRPPPGHALDLTDEQMHHLEITSVISCVLVQRDVHAEFLFPKPLSRIKHFE